MTAVAKMAPYGEASVTLTRVFDAPRKLVWKAWTDPKMMARWFGPRAFTNPVCELDVRVGGHEDHACPANLCIRLCSDSSANACRYGGGLDAEHRQAGTTGHRFGVTGHSSDQHPCDPAQERRDHP